MSVDWRQFHADNAERPVVVDSRRRLAICLACFVVVLLTVFGRVVQLEITQGEGFRAIALRPIEKQTPLPAPRGRILARNGDVLAADRTIPSVAVEYRWLQDPPDAGWLRTMARTRLSKTERQNAQKLADARTAVLADRVALAERLRKLCGLSAEQWAARIHRIQNQVERIATEANRQRPSETTDSDEEKDSWAIRLRRLLLEDPPPPRISVAEELSPQVVVENVSPAVVEEIQTHADRYSGTKIIEIMRRTYPQGTSASHILGHLGPVESEQLKQTNAESSDDPRYLPSDLVGRMGVERQYEAVLQGCRGKAVEQSEHGGRVIAAYHAKEPSPGSDITLTLDATLQRTAEELLAAGLERRSITSGSGRIQPSGGAIVVLNVHNGEILVSASAPAFDPNAFLDDAMEKRAALLTDAAHPLFDRVGRMAIPPGSTFKIITAAALLDSAAVDPRKPFTCQGYLHRPDRQRCEIFVRQGIGHGEVTLADALAVSCNVYFFHFAGAMGPRPLVDWAERFGFGHVTGVDLPGESAGVLPTPENLPQLEGHAWCSHDTESLAVGQSSLTTTPLQIARMTAAIANGGQLVTPHVVARINNQALDLDPPHSIAGLTPAMLQTIREGLRRVVADPKGTAHATVYWEPIAIAGKTGTAETGEDRASHAWFAGYVPADDPKWAFVIVLEHAGEASLAAGPLAKRLVLRMDQLGLL
jgi:penicillin-binding protein 2